MRNARVYIYLLDPTHQGSFKLSGKPYYQYPPLLARIMSSPTQAISCDHITKLPEDILGRILFAGYLSTTWYWTVALILVSKKFQNLGHTYIAHVCNVNRFELDPLSLRPRQLSAVCIQAVAKSVVYLDLGFADLQYTPELGRMLLNMRATMRGLSLRGACVKDDFVGEYIAQLTQLKYLNISQTKGEDKGNITDTGALHLRALTRLRWLNISMTNITSTTILELQSAVSTLTHLDVYGCKLLKDDMFPALMQWRLRSLDISNCPLLSLNAIEVLCANR
jgi:hypothetical protein